MNSSYTPTKYDSVFWVEVDRIEPNPFQPRIDFDEERLKSLAESIRQYGVLQPLVVVRNEREKEDGGLAAMYQLIAGERRLRASKLIGLREVPVVIRQGEQSDKMKLELAIIENLQREDLNAIDRAKALAQLAETFGISHAEIGAKIGRSREYVSNSIRLLALPEPIQQAVVGKEITEGHARALLMLTDRPEERDTLFKEIVLKKTSVRMVEQMARRIAQDKIRKHDKSPEVMELERSLTETLGTRVLIENRPNGGRVLIEFFSPEDLSHIASVLAEKKEEETKMSPEATATAEAVSSDMPIHPNTTQVPPLVPQQPEEDIYSVQNFTV
ncbi:MAG TPA: ParB/RepB/Spo0J family partition protein [Candidatus Paceibacterota bacterium]|jgi:ParB family chromosome partitioning protein